MPLNLRHHDSFVFVFQFPARRDGAEQDGSAARRRGHHLRDEVHDHPGLHDGPPLLPARLAELHRRDRKL